MQHIMLRHVLKWGSSINVNKLLMGIAMILLNVGSKYIELGFSKTQEQALRNALGREILIFAIVFTATQDIILSILMTAAFVILANHLLNNESPYCIVPNRFWKIADAVDINNDGIISPQEEAWALEILRKVGEQRRNAQQHVFTAQLDAYKY